MNEVTKDPDAVLSYGFDWANGGANDGSSTDTGWLQGDTITASTWSVSGNDAGLVVDSDSNSTTQSSVVLSGGTVGQQYKATNHITTAAGLQDDRSLLVTVSER